jgi:hypothetical protein
LPAVIDYAARVVGWFEKYMTGEDRGALPGSHRS